MSARATKRPSKRSRTRTASRLPPPTWEARKHQAPGVQHLLRRPAAALFMVPGAGKTTTVLAAYWMLRNQGMIDVLIVVAPLRPAHEVWPQQVEEWSFPFKVEVLHGDKKDEALRRKADVYVVNYDGLEWLTRPENLKVLRSHGKRRMLAFDESTKIKNTSTTRYKWVRQLLAICERRIILTGTPRPQGLEDLFGQIFALDFGARLGQYITQYRRTYFYPGGFGGRKWVPQPEIKDGRGKVVSKGAEERVREAIAELCYYVGDDALGLPEKVDVPVWIKLDKKTQRAYEEFEREFVLELRSGVVTAVNSAVLSSKLRQIANGGVYDQDKRWRWLHDAKLEALEDLVEELNGEPLLLGYEFTPEGERIAKHFKAPWVYGKTNPKEAATAFAAFNAGDLPLLVVQAGAAAHGLNLQKASHHIAWFGRPWSVETYIQFMRRVHRLGQKKRVFIHHLLTRDTVQEHQFNAMKRNITNQDKFLEYIRRQYA